MTKFLRAKNSCSPALKTNAWRQSRHESVLSSKDIDPALGTYSKPQWLYRWGCITKMDSGFPNELYAHLA